MEEVERHIKLSKKNYCSVALIVGDPERVDKVKLLCDSYVDLAYHREYKSAECHYKGQKFLCVSHGVGSAGCAICVEELINIGVKVLIRAGSCGTLQPHEMKRGDICVCHAAIREDRLSHLIINADFPAVADFEVYDTLLKCANELNEHIFTGMCLTSDLYYKHSLIPNQLELYSKAHVAINDMELATVMVIGSLKKVKVGGIFIVDGSPLKWDEGNFDPVLNPEKLKNMIIISLNACARLAAKYK
ncbi:purine nucleoside phosphorylase, putative [Plasmodium gallinaceum]|uniref:Purine nucleoside phosphorylase, putative n=1 Tax=Plasmodium gallinaceum TaxID=5849 RepID=A0A1J1H3F9_PLAGA|nr:purine nucleoside phosphorylase, putative [Plasmodium gallinaceum]CRG97880.1 purine nucleoside phosphorylase, putative [Plasmodium gallinaceum]